MGRQRHIRVLVRGVWQSEGTHGRDPLRREGRAHHRQCRHREGCLHSWIVTRRISDAGFGCCVSAGLAASIDSAPAANVAAVREPIVPAFVPRWCRAYARAAVVLNRVGIIPFTFFPIYRFGPRSLRYHDDVVDVVGRQDDLAAETRRTNCASVKLKNR